MEGRRADNAHAIAREIPLGFAIAAYVLVIGSLVAYGLRINAQRRALRRARHSGAGPGGAPRA